MVFKITFPYYYLWCLHFLLSLNLSIVIPKLVFWLVVSRNVSVGRNLISFPPRVLYSTSHVLLYKRSTIGLVSPLRNQIWACNYHKPFMEWWLGRIKQNVHHQKHISSAIALWEYDFPRVKKIVCILLFYAINIYCEPAWTLSSLYNYRMSRWMVRLRLWKTMFWTLQIQRSV